MRLFFFGFFLFQVVVVVGSGFGVEVNDADSPASSKWVCVKKNKGIVLYERWVHVTKSLCVRERKGEMVVDCSFSEVINYLSDSYSIKEWMAGVKKVDRIITQKGNGNLVYVIIHLPFPLENRDLVARINVLHPDLTHSIIRICSENGVREKDEDFVRITSYKASWALEKLGGHKTKVVFQSFSKEAPLLPLWIQEPVLKKMFFANLVRLKDILSGS